MKKECNVNFCNFCREGSEKSWSDSSERSWKKGPRTNTRNDNSRPKYNNKKFDNKRTNFNDGAAGGDNWNIGTVPDLPDLAPKDAAYELLQLNGTTASVTISWFHNPSHFYCQLLDMNVSHSTYFFFVLSTIVVL